MKEQDHDNINIDCPTAEKILSDLYLIKGQASPLPGEYDMNFRIQADQMGEFILKVSRPGTDPGILDFQQSLLTHLEGAAKGVTAPRILPDRSGNPVSSYTDSSGRMRAVRLLSWIPGRMYHKVLPKSDALRFSIGVNSGKLSKALLGFDHPKAHRTFEWDLANSLWTTAHLHLFSNEERELVSFFQEKFSKGQHGYRQLRKSVIHNDANDRNLIVSTDLKDPVVIAAIDYGDAIFSQTVNDLAVACAYGIMNLPDPLSAAVPIVQGYHRELPLLEEELEHLYSAIGMRLVISVTKSAINKTKDPENAYLQISEAPAWELLSKWRRLSEELALFSFRETCGFEPHPSAAGFANWARSQKVDLKTLFPTVNKNDCTPVDLSVSSTWLGHQEEFDDFDRFQFKLDQLQKKHPEKIIAGGYLEPRLVYTTAAYDKPGNSGKESRSIHLGIDFWLSAGTPVHALFEGEVVTAVNDEGDREYGGLVILRHEEKGHFFYTLYGHLSVASATQNKVGDVIGKGDRIAELGQYPENGNWTPHLHFQVMLSMLDYEFDFPGVGYFNQMELWKSICPDPNLLFQLKSLPASETIDNKALMDFRSKHLGPGLSLSYDQPIQVVRGQGAWLIDQFGRKFLDTVNNVAHVGHEHYAVVRAGQDQMALLNTNTRYLHPNITALAGELMKTLPAELEVFHFVNSGSEANELALRMAKTVTGERDVLASEAGYHGNTSACIAISSYKFDGKGGQGCPEHTHIFPLPDTFRGKYHGPGARKKYAMEVRKLIDHISELGRGVAAFIVEPIISCGGQIELPEDFLTMVYEEVRKAGGLCISDEVQVGCGRLGKTFWGFQLHGVTPDIVTIGKPLGNGHPIAAVACTRHVAERFANGMEYFNTFGGNPVSCAVATEVLKVIEREQLMEQAQDVGTYLKEALRTLAEEFPVIGDVRGQGLFLGFELTDAKRQPLADQARYLINRMRDHNILMSLDGPEYNVIKIKPPLVFSREQAAHLIYYLKKILSEDHMQI